MIEGRDKMDVRDIEKCTPSKLKQNKIKNTPDYSLLSSDIYQPKMSKFHSNRVTDPLNPIYKVET